MALATPQDSGDLGDPFVLPVIKDNGQLLNWRQPFNCGVYQFGSLDALVLIGYGFGLPVRNVNERTH